MKLIFSDGFRSNTQQNSVNMGYRSEKGFETGARAALREACEAQPLAGAAETFEHSVLERPHEPPGERVRCGRRLHLHGAV